MKGFNNRRYHEEVIATTKKMIDACAAGGVPNVIAFTGYKWNDADDPKSGEISRDEGAQLRQGLKEVAGYAEKKGVTICVEHLNMRDHSHPMKGHPGYQGDDLDWLAGILRKVGSPRVKLLFDIYHVQIMHGDVIRRFDQCKDIIGHVHTAGNPGRAELDDTQEINYPPIMRKLLESNTPATSGRNSSRRETRWPDCGRPWHCATCEWVCHDRLGSYAVCMRLLPYAQLLRLPNVFTAFADILMGTLAAGTLMHRPLAAVLLLLASGCLYCSGMVWNDYFDFEIDRKERPFRPLPSGKISRSTARRIGLILILAGLIFASGAGFHAEGWDSRPVVVACTLVAAILMYDVWLKHTPIGPVGMGTCRFLNVLMATSLADASILPSSHRVHLALVVGVYIVGVTWFARGEAGRSLPGHLAAQPPSCSAPTARLGLARTSGRRNGDSGLSLFARGLRISCRDSNCKGDQVPEAQSVQAAIKRCILGLVVLDAILATVYVGLAGLAIILLLPPALLLGRRVYST